jgi:hypothetical protein
MVFGKILHASKLKFTKARKRNKNFTFICKFEFSSKLGLSFVHLIAEKKRKKERMSTTINYARNAIQKKAKKTNKEFGDYLKKTSQ